MKVKNIIFISHRSTDKDIADMLVDFFVGTGIPKEAVFCSSLPGNDINERISGEVKAALKNSAVNIAILYVRIKVCGRTAFLHDTMRKGALFQA